MCSATVTVIDDEAPSLTCLEPMVLECAGSTGVTLGVNAQASDNCPGVSSSCVPPSGSTFPLGTTNVSCTATDDAGRVGYILERAKGAKARVYPIGAITRSREGSEIVEMEEAWGGKIVLETGKGAIDSVDLKCYK